MFARTLREREKKYNNKVVSFSTLFLMFRLFFTPILKTNLFSSQPACLSATLFYILTFSAFCIFSRYVQVYTQQQKLQKSALVLATKGSVCFPCYKFE